MNTDAFMGKDIPQEVTKKLIEDLANGNIQDSDFKPFGNFRVSATYQLMIMKFTLMTQNIKRP
ncbi:hypothetical protein IMAU40093_00985 [Lactobacillus helveticus]|nr:hypothetical protein [Lactobacillus helveticus]